LRDSVRHSSSVLLVEPNFPYPSKSLHTAGGVHKNFVPVGLLKLGAYHKSLGHEVALVRGNVGADALRLRDPDLVLVTSLFTYWSAHVWAAVAHYRSLFPTTRIIVGGIYATLLGDTPEFRRNLRQYDARLHPGLHPMAEKQIPDYGLLRDEAEYHATHAMRGCIRRCDFCGTWRLEPDRMDKTPDELVSELGTVGKNKVIFYDNSFLANAHARDILLELARFRVRGRPVLYESQSGFDGRLLDKAPEMAELVNKARFRNVRIAWDNSYDDAPAIRRQIGYLASAGYDARDLTVFILYNYRTPYEECLRKLEACAKLGVQISDCRYRPLTVLSDGYRPRTRSDASPGYYVHTEAGWTDEKVHDFRRRVREHNIWIRYARSKGEEYDRRMEHWSAIHNTFKFFGLGMPPKMEELDGSYTWKRRLSLLRQARTACERVGSRPDLGGLSHAAVDSALRVILDDAYEPRQQPVLEPAGDAKDAGV